MKNSRSIGIAFVIGGLIVTLAFSAFTIRTALFIFQSKKTSGRVVDMVVRSLPAKDGSVIKTTTPLVRYKDNSGNNQEFELTSSLQNNLRIGQKILVRYQPGHEAKTAMVAGTFFQTWGMIFFLGLLCLVLNGIGFPVLFKSLRN